MIITMPKIDTSELLLSNESRPINSKSQRINRIYANGQLIGVIDDFKPSSTSVLLTKEDVENLLHRHGVWKFSIVQSLNQLVTIKIRSYWVSARYAFDKTTGQVEGWPINVKKIMQDINNNKSICTLYNVNKVSFIQYYLRPIRYKYLKFLRSRRKQVKLTKFDYM